MEIGPQDSIALPVGVATGAVIVLGLAIASAIILIKVWVTKHEHTYEDVTGGKKRNMPRVTLINY
jgi:hypothetical protein